MTWTLIAAKAPRKQLARFPAKDRERTVAALQAMEQNPFSGDVLKLEGSNGRWRRRVGSYRIFFAIDSNTGTVAVSAMVPAYVQDVLELHENRGIPG